MLRIIYNLFLTTVALGLFGLLALWFWFDQMTIAIKSWLRAIL